MGHEEVRGQHLLNHRAHTRQGELGLSAPSAFVLKKAVGGRRQHDVPLPARQAAPFEVIEPEFVLEFLVLLLDCPAW